MSGLTHKQHAFTEEYLKDFNGTWAARRAGYRGDDNTLAVQASRLLRNDNVKKRIKARLQAKAMLADEVLSRLADQARGDIADFVEIDPKTNKVTLNLQKALQGKKTHLIHKLDVTDTGVTRIELYNARAALQLIGKHLALFVDRRELSGPGGGPIPVFNVEEWKENRANRLKQADEITDG